MSNEHPHGGGRILHAGAELQDATTAVILLHGRGATAADIIRLGSAIAPAGETTAFLAPQATDNTWYPVSGFLPPAQLAPWLESALTVIDDLVDTILAAGVPAERIVVGGFSQGAMLSLEYGSRGRRHIGGIIAFSGSVVGPADTPHAPFGDATGLRVFIGCGTNDSWIPAAAAQRSAELFTAAGALVDLRIYEGMDHTINHDEIDGARELVTSLEPSAR